VRYREHCTANIYFAEKFSICSHITFEKSRDLVCTVCDPCCLAYWSLRTRTSHLFWSNKFWPV